MKNNNFTDSAITVEVDTEEETTLELKDVLATIEAKCLLEDEWIHGITAEMLTQLLFEVDEDIVNDTVGHDTIGIDDVVSYLEDYPTATLYARFTRDSDGNIDWIYLKGLVYHGEITKEILIDFYHVFRFVDGIFVEDDSIEAYF